MTLFFSKSKEFRCYITYHGCATKTEKLSLKDIQRGLCLYVCPEVQKCKCDGVTLHNKYV